ncbi:MAG: haloacid dehalogenase-like hydrolase, partial [Akkermansiaceae bacterium]
VEEIFPDEFYGDMLDIFAQQKASGRTVVLSSASPDIWVRPIAEKLGADFFFGTKVELDGRVRFFPDLLGGNNKGSNKLTRMREVLPEGFDPSSGELLANSRGFSDSHADLPMLSICEANSMVHPTDKLAAVGEEKGWSLHTPERPTRGRRQFAVACLRQALGIW